MEEIRRTYREEEEFLYDEDYDRSDKQILKKYQKDKVDVYQDGVDYIGDSMTKRELASSLRSMRKEIVRRNEDCQRGLRK